MVYRLKQTEKAAPLFAGWQETMIWSCLQGAMGRMYADRPERPVSAAALLGDFCFLAGKPNRELMFCGSDQQEFLIMVPGSRAWAELIEECYGAQAEKVVRYAFRKEPDAFDQVFLQAAVDGLPEEYTLRMMDEELFWRCR